jgi:hypothetical protein
MALSLDAPPKCPQKTLLGRSPAQTLKKPEIDSGFIKEIQANSNQPIFSPLAAFARGTPSFTGGGISHQLLNAWARLLGLSCKVGELKGNRQATEYTQDHQTKYNNDVSHNSLRGDWGREQLS